MKIFVFQEDFVYSCAVPIFLYIVCLFFYWDKYSTVKAVSSSQKEKKKRKEKRYRIVLAMKLIANIKRTVITIKDASILHSSVWLSQ